MNIWDGNAIDSPGSYRWMESTLISKGWYRVHKRTFLSFLDLVVYRFHTWTPCWLIFPISCLGLWKLRLPSQEAMNKKFHVFSAKSIISSVTHISVGGRTTQWPGEASENTQALAHWFQIIRLFPLRSHFFISSLYLHLWGPFQPNLQNDELYVSKTVHYGVQVTFNLQSFTEYLLYTIQQYKKLQA